ncbi:hypothetical protein WA158_005907 [Blastocystis sp. Blastoise]
MKSIYLFFALAFIASVNAVCTAPSVAVTVTHYCTTYGYEELWNIYTGAVVDINQKVANGQGANSVTTVTEVCLLLNTVYTLGISDSYGDGWSYYSTITVTYDGFDYVSGMGLAYGEATPKTVQFTLTSILSYGSTWKYSTAAQVGNSWAAPSFADATWSSAATGAFPTIATTTRYFRFSGILATAAVAFNMEILSNSGYIVYINGQEVSRVGLPAVSDANTASTLVEETATYKTLAFPLSLYSVTTSFTVAIEVHAAATQIGSPEVFDAKASDIKGTEKPIYYGYGGTGVCVPENTGSTAEKCEKLFDGTVSTQYLSSGSRSCVITYTLPANSKIWINSYAIGSGNDMQGRDPREWKFYGSQDSGVTWKFLDYRNENLFASRKTMYPFEILSNRLMFNAFKLEVLNNNGEGAAQMSEVSFGAINKAIPAAGIQYDSATVTVLVFVEVNLKVTSTGYYDFSITPALPAGLFFNSANGNIYGTPTNGFSMTVYTVYATDGATDQTVTTSVTITINGCQQPAMSLVTITKANGGSVNFAEERFTAYSEAGVSVFSGVGNGGTQTYSDCVVAGRMRFVLNDDGNNGWDQGSSLKVTVQYGVNQYFTVGRLYLQTGTTATYYVNTRLDLAPMSGWKYFPATVIDPNWYSMTFSDAAWSSITALPVASVATPIVLLRKSFTVTSKTNMKGWEFMFMSRAGVVVYVNGNEVYRYNLADGPITTATTPTGGDSSFSWKGVSGKLSTLSNGNSVTIAVALVNIGTEAYYLTFDGVFHLTADSTVQQDIEGTYYTTNNDIGGFAGGLFDGSFGSRWITGLHDSVTPHYATITFKNNRAELINKYCVVSNYDAPGYDPVDWVVAGSMDGTSFTDLSTMSNVSWEERQQRQCFYMPTNNKAYITYRWTVSKAAEVVASNRYAACEFELYIEDIESLVIPAFSFTPSTIVAYKDVTVPALLVSSEYYYDFTISPALPTGLTMDTSNGYLNGIATQLQSPTTYTISAKNIQGTPVATTITLSVTTCSEPNTAFVLKFYFEGGAGEASWTLKDAAGTVIDTKTTAVDWATQYFSYCKPKGIYSLVLSDSMNDGWGAGTYTILDIDNNVYATGTVASQESPKTVSVYIGQVIGSSTSWKYLNDGSAAPSGWNTASFSDDSWSTGIAGFLPTLTGNTQYYRTIFSVSAIDATSAGYEISIKGYAGIAVYLNGQEIMRSNLPTGTLSSSTLATSELANWSFFKASLSLIANPILVVGTNVLAIELHKKETLPTTNEFTGSFAFIASGEYRVTDGVAWSDIEKTDYEGTDKLFDNSIYTKVLSGPRCVGAIYQYTFNNGRKEFINHYKITNANDCNQRSPSSWRIEGSNDNGITWNLLDFERQQLFTSYRQTFSYDFYSSQPYNSYRMVATECSNRAFNNVNCGDGNFQLSEFGLYITNTPSSCAASGIWGPAVEGGYSFQECPAGYLGAKRRLCTAGVFGDEQDLCYLTAPTDLAYTGSPFTLHKNIYSSIPATVTGAELTFTIYPSLPNGLILNPSNGMISGTPTTNSALTTYTITATNTAGSVSTTIVIYIDIVFCTSEYNWPLTEIGQQYDLPCEDLINYEGSRTRLCKLGYPAIWDTIINNCELRMPSIIYTVPTTIGYKNVPITPITALITGSNLNPLTISPSLPNGLFFNSITGLIYGTPTTTTSSSSVLYTITISNPRGESTATITITIKDSSCPIDDIWPITEAGEQAILDCEDTINYEGFRTRLCIRGDPAVWGDIINNCQLLLPTISYATTNIIGNKNNAITPVAATITGGNLNPLTISPSLPDGLIFNTENGQIYGIPTSDSSNSYTITISNPTGQSTVTITITISASNCISDDIWPATEAGQQITLPCEDTMNYEGFRTRLCKLEYPAVWGDIINNCQLKMPSIIYDITTITGYKNIAINSVNATITGGNLNSITINPSLPDGLIFNTENGQIYGTPTSSSSGSYVITVSNPRGEDNAVINIIINIYNCIMDDIWPVTEAGEQVTLPCEDTINYEGFRTRLCLLGNPAVWEDAVNNCQLKNPSISYITTTITGYKNIGITPIIASITGGNLNPLTINPSLPDGLSFNNQNGQIYGTPTSDSSNSYTISISNSRGESTATITIIISIANCPDDTVWSATEIGQQITLPCEDPINYEGFRTRLCKLEYPAVWDTVINNCQLKMPSISYHTNEIIGYKNIAITPVVASITGGNLNPLTISPSLPDGLSFNPTTGLIYGIPTSDSSNTYTVTISNSRGESTTTITITISIISCVAENGWSMTEIGQQITLPCEDPINYEGFRTRLCKLGYPAVWDTVINNCELKNPTISYNTNTIIGYKNDIITPIMASITGGNLNPLTISPSLPDGLIFNTQNGFIYGIPTSASSNSYTITASNARGESTATITITISIVYCPSDDNWPITERDITAYIECPSGQLGIQSRVCQNTGVGTASWQIADNSDCYIFITNENPGDNKIFIDVPIKLEGLTEAAFNTPSTTETFRTLIVQSLTSYSIPSSAVKIISVSSISTYTDGVSVNVRITANESDEDNIKNDINTLFTGIDSILLKACKTSNDSNLQNITNTSINGKIKEKKEKKLQPHKKTPEIETVKVEKPVTL